MYDSFDRRGVLVLPDSELFALDLVVIEMADDLFGLVAGLEVCNGRTFVCFTLRAIHGQIHTNGLGDP